MRCIRLLLEYDGTDFVGWQAQPNGRSVQGEITRVLEEVLQEHVNLIGAGRTDSGVHARGQVAGFRTNSELAPDTILKALNGMVPEDICIRTAEEVRPDFHARYDARSRMYRYFISRTPLAIGRRYHWQLKYPLDLDIMRIVAGQVMGRHDFRAFCSKEEEVENTVCTVMTSTWVAEETRLVYEVRADRFVHGMVRALVGTMVDIGRGYTPLSDFLLILDSKDRTKSGMTAPAQGLVLEDVAY
jgi:tRNA pseudouridine38-40 synthase